MRYFLATGAVLLMFEVPAEAYLDPGSGSMLVQLILGGVAGAAVVLKLGWQRVRDVFRSSDGKERRPDTNG